MMLAGTKFFTYADVPMLAYGCGVYHYPHFHYWELYKYQVLPRPYLGSFDSLPADKFIKEKYLLGLAGQAKTFVWESIEKK